MLSRRKKRTGPFFGAVPIGPYIKKEEMSFFLMNRQLAPLGSVLIRRNE